LIDSKNEQIEAKFKLSQDDLTEAQQ
jgi:hypothetical protein